MYAIVRPTNPGAGSAFFSEGKTASQTDPKVQIIYGARGDLLKGNAAWKFSQHLLPAVLSHFIFSRLFFMLFRFLRGFFGIKFESGVQTACDKRDKRFFDAFDAMFVINWQIVSTFLPFVNMINER